MKKYLPSMVLGTMLMIMISSNTSLRDYYGAQLLPSLQTDQFLTLYLPLDGDVNDPTTIVQTAQKVGNQLERQNCIVGSCLEFDGLDDYIDVGKTTNELGIQNSDFTAMAWVNGANYTNFGPFGLDQSVMGTNPESSNVGLHLTVRNSRPYLGFFDNDTAGVTPLTTNSWIHLTFRYKKTTGEQAIFVNGVLDNQTAGHGAFGGNNNLFIGRSRGGNYFDGLIDEVRVYNRALSFAEIQEIINLQPISTPPAPPPAGPSITSQDVLALGGSHYVRVKKGESGDQACQRVGAENTLTGSCTNTSKTYDDQNPTSTVCSAFHPTATPHDASTQNTSDPAQSAFGSNSIGFCDNSTSITCDQKGSLRDPSSPSPLTNTCQTCSTCQPTNCSTIPDSLGLDELYVECAFSDPNICTTEDKVGVYTLEQEIFEEFTGTKSLGVNNNQITIDLIELIRTDLDAGEAVPDDILVTKLDIIQGNPNNVNFLLDSQSVAIITKPQGSFSVPLNAPSIRADRIVVPPSNGITISYIRERKTIAESPQTFTISNEAAVRDLGAIESFSGISAQIPQGGEVTYRLKDISGQIAIWVAPVSFEGTIPLSTQQTDKKLEHIFACKDSDADGICDVTTCPDLVGQTGTIRNISVDHQTSGIAQKTEALLIPDEGIQVTSTCPTCSLSFDKDPILFKGGQSNTDNGFFLHVRSIDSADGSVAHTLLLFGPVETMDRLIQRNGKTRFQFVTPSVLSLAQNDYAFQRVSPTGVTEIIPVEGQVLESHLSKPLINSESYQHLFLVQSADNVWLVHSTPARYWNINTLTDANHTPQDIKKYFDLLPSSPSPDQCEQTLGQLPTSSELLENANSFQLFLDLLTLCNRL